MKQLPVHWTTGGPHHTCPGSPGSLHDVAAALDSGVGCGALQGRRPWGAGAGGQRLRWPGGVRVRPDPSGALQRSHPRTQGTS